MNTTKSTQYESKHFPISDIFYLGLLITFIELIKNPSYKFWEHEFVHCAPEIQKLFESVARSCMVRIYLYCFTIAIVEWFNSWFGATFIAIISAIIIFRFTHQCQQVSNQCLLKKLNELKHQNKNKHKKIQVSNIK